MSLIGIRDMSVLEEAPNERMPIQTYVMEYNDEMVREAITRELARDGQVYYVYNRVNDIADVAGRIQNLVPDANVAFAHGQMKERELEDIMYDLSTVISMFLFQRRLLRRIGYSECEYDDHTGCGPIRIISALSASGTCRSF